MKFNRVRPCAHCPLRSDVTPYIRPERAQEIASSLYGGSTFTCHETTVVGDYDSGEMVNGPNAQMCAGAVITMEREQRPNQALRMAERIGLCDASRMDMAAPVYSSLAQWADAFIPDSELEHCGVVAEDCEDPAGYAYGDGAVSNADEPTCDPENSCGACGAVMCSACQSGVDEDGYPLCVYCAETVVAVS